MPDDLHLVPHSHQVTRAQRTAIKPHQPAVLWFTGLSGSGKSTIANSVEEMLNRVYRAHTYLLDGDNVRGGLNRDLGFSEADRSENIRRIGEVARLFYDAGLIVLTAFISPFRADRDRVRALLPKGAFIEVFVDCPLAVCEARDPKGLYKKARTQAIAEFTGISSPYEPPTQSELTLNSAAHDVAVCSQIVITYLVEHGILTP